MIFAAWYPPMTPINPPKKEEVQAEYDQLLMAKEGRYDDPGYVLAPVMNKLREANIGWAMMHIPGRGYKIKLLDVEPTPDG